MSQEDRIFDRWADHYDSDMINAEQTGDWMYTNYMKILKKIVAIVEKWQSGRSDALVLDIGAGTGNLTKLIHDAGIKVTGIEPAKKMRAKFKEKLLSLEILRGDFLDIPLHDNCADAIVSSYAWHHLTDGDKEKSIDEMSRVLKIPGLIVIADFMFEDEKQRESKINQLNKCGYTDIIEDIESEHYADISHMSAYFSTHEFQCENTQMTEYVWIMRAAHLRLSC